MCIWVFKAALYPSTKEKENKLLHICTTENYSAIINKLLYTPHMGESQKYYSKWKEPDTEDYAIYDSLNEILEKKKIIVIESRSIFARG